MPHPASPPLSVGPDFLAIDATAQFPLGTVAFGTEGRVYRYVKFVDIATATYAANKMTCIASATTWDVSIDASGGAALAGLWPTGMTISVPTAAKPYGWVQIAGIADFVAGSASIIAGDLLMPDTEDGDLTEAVAGTNENIAAVALDTVADNATGKCLLTLRGF